MPFSELQIALIGAGLAAVGGVWGYNVWQDRKHRQAADRIFKGGSGDALLGPGNQESGIRDPGPADGERREPSLAGEAAADFVDPVAESAKPLLPEEYADEMVDCLLHLTAVDPIPAPAVWAIQNTWAGELGKAVHWLARNDADGAWQPVDAHDVGRYREWAVALQLVDRQGPVSDGELSRFFDGVQQLAQQTAAALELPSRGAIVMRAGKLDEFCAAVDIQFVLHVVDASGGVFAGTKLRGVAEAAGLALEGDGSYRARDSTGGELFSVGNFGAERFDADTLKSLATHGLTLTLDVPRVTDGALAFDQMLATARQLAVALGGVLVDAQRAPLADAMIDAIRARAVELQQRMNHGGIAPGSIRALRLFS